MFLDMSTKEISGHPDVGLSTGHVDVVLQRCRERMRKCMTSKGFEVLNVPPGTFTELWRAFRMDETLAAGSNYDA